MNAVIALCNFCELHGPSVLLCTQAFHDMEDASVSGLEKSQYKKPLRQKEWYGPRYFNDKSNPTSVPFKKDGCEGCISMTAECRGYISSDHEARVSYVSSQFPLHPDVFSLVRQACVRSLSCEVSPGGEGPIYFGDNDRGHVISYTFFLKDSQARGFQSWYSIVIVSTDKIFLLNSWPFLVKRCEQIAVELQRKALENFNSEQLSNNLKAMQLDSVTRMNLDAFRRKRGNVKARSIKSLITADVFLYLHSQFTWILKTGACRISERLFEGFPNDESEVDLENQEEIEDGFIKIHIKKIVGENSFSDNCDNEENSELNMSDNEITFKSIKELYLTIGYNKFHTLAHHTIIGTLIIMRSKYLSLAKSIILCLRVILPQSCFNPVFSSNTYKVPDNCNFLTISPNVNISDDVIRKHKLHVEIDLIPKDNVTLKDVILNMKCDVELPEKPPQMLTKVEKILVSEEFPIQAIDTFLFTQKKIWTNNAKILSTFFRIRPRTSEEVKKMYDAHHIQDCDEPLLKFWMNELSFQEMF